MVSTMCPKFKLMWAILGRKLEDILPIMDAYIKGQHITIVYTNESAQICLMSESMMHYISLEVDNPAFARPKWQTIRTCICVGVVN